MWLFRKRKQKQRESKAEVNHRIRIEKSRDIALMKMENERKMDEVGKRVVRFALDEPHSGINRHFSDSCKDKLATMNMTLVNRLINRQIRLEQLSVDMQEEELRNHQNYVQQVRSKSLRCEMKDLTNDLKKYPPKRAMAESRRLEKLRQANKYKNEIIHSMWEHSSSDEDDTTFGSNNTEALAKIQDMRQEAIESDLLEAPNVITTSHHPIDSSVQQIINK